MKAFCWTLIAVILIVAAAGAGAIYGPKYLPGIASFIENGGEVVKTATVADGAPGATAAQNSIAVEGTGSMRMNPDIATLSLGIAVAADDVMQAQSDANTAKAAIVAALKAAGVAEEDISVSYLNVSASYDYSATPERITGYTASHQLSVIVRDIGKTGATIDAALRAGANRLDGVQFTSSDVSKTYQQAMALAITDAEIKAKAAATAAGKKLGRLVSLSEGSYGYREFNSGLTANATEAASDSATVVDAGYLNIQAAVNATYELID